MDNGEWVEGYYVYVDYLDKHCIVNRIKNPHGVDFIVQMTEYDVDCVEAVFQRDSVNEECVDLVGELVEIMLEE